MEFKFDKMHGAGNDFIVIDDRACRFPDMDGTFVRRISARGVGIGCEGVLLLRMAETLRGFDYKMVFLNPDGSRASMCGNAARCAALYSYVYGIGGRRQHIETDAGDIFAEILESAPGHESVCIRMPTLKNRSTVTVRDGACEYKCICVDSGVPHAVVFVQDASSVDVEKTGRLIRNDEAFSPEGTNVDFVEIKSRSELVMRTYERGVEGESGACGTGAAAAAAMFAENFSGVFPVRIRVSSGDCLNVTGEIADNGMCGTIYVSGPARFVFKGTLKTESPAAR